MVAFISRETGFFAGFTFCLLQLTCVRRLTKYVSLMFQFGSEALLRKGLVLRVLPIEDPCVRIRVCSSIYSVAAQPLTLDVSEKDSLCIAFGSA